MFFNIDVIIVIGFLTLNLICGLLSGYGIKNIREYAIGNKNFLPQPLLSQLQQLGLLVLILASLCLKPIHKEFLLDM